MTFAAETRFGTTERNSTSRSLTRGRESTETVINEVKSNELESQIGAWTDFSSLSGHAPKRLARQAPENRIVATRRGYNEHIGPESIGHFKLCKENKVAIFNGIELIQVACSSLPCTLYNAFMWKVSVKAGQSELKRV